jgi:uncharacterized repeat protein (TIGR03803 family)
MKENNAVFVSLEKMSNPKHKVRSVFAFGALSLPLLLVLMMPCDGWATTKEKVIYSFAGGGSGSTTSGILTFDKAGNLYGVAVGAGTGQNGVVFELTRAKSGQWTKANLYSFLGGDDGSGPEAGVIFDKAGDLYGVTGGGGSGSSGTVFELMPGKNGDWTETVLYSFTGGPDGGFPNSILSFDEAGNLFGTTESGGSPGNGTVFELMPGQSGRWTEKVLHAFKGHADGMQPLAGVIFDGAGTLYGTTESGGKYGLGIIFELSPAKAGKWKETILHAFQGTPDGSNPAAGLVLSGGILYGTTYSGGDSTCGVDGGCGTVFQLASNGSKWKESIIYSFQGSDGIESLATPVFDQAGNLYGTTFEGGSGSCNVCGTAFELTPIGNNNWQETVLHDFGSKSGDAGTPASGVIVNKSGKLFGTTTLGGNDNAGAVYEITH